MERLQRYLGYTLWESSNYMTNQFLTSNPQSKRNCVKSMNIGHWVLEADVKRMNSICQQAEKRGWERFILKFLVAE